MSKQNVLLTSRKIFCLIKRFILLYLRFQVNKRPKERRSFFTLLLLGYVFRALKSMKIEEQQKSFRKKLKSFYSIWIILSINRKISLKEQRKKKRQTASGSEANWKYYNMQWADAEIKHFRVHVFWTTRKFESLNAKQQLYNKIQLILIILLLFFSLAFFPLRFLHLCDFFTSIFQGKAIISLFRSQLLTREKSPKILTNVCWGMSLMIVNRIKKKKENQRRKAPYRVSSCNLFGVVNFKAWKGKNSTRALNH